MDKATERDLVVQFKCAKEKREALKDELKHRRNNDSANCNRYIALVRNGGLE